MKENPPLPPYRGLENQEIKELARQHQLQYELEQFSPVSWWQDFLEYLQNLFETLFGVLPQAQYIENFIYLLAAVILGVALYRIFRGMQPGLREDVHSGSYVSPLQKQDIAGRNFNQEIEQARQQGHYRLMLRLMYLHILQQLHRKKLIHYSLDKTNHDYDYELRNKPFYPHFARLSLLFDYGWYGHYTLQEATLQEAENTYKSLMDGLGK